MKNGQRLHLGLKYCHMTVLSQGIAAAYKHLAKPIFFRLEPEDVHDRVTAIGHFIGEYRVGRLLTERMFAYRDPILEQTIHGMQFINPVGLSAGFDKNAQLLNILPSVGFGFAEMGSITGEPCEGNPRPRLWRMPDQQSLVVYYGLKNDGCDVVVERVAHAHHGDMVVGISVAKTNNRETCDTERGIEDYAKAFARAADAAEYITINISCPNTFGGEPFSDPQRFDALMTRLDAIPASQPLFIKLSPDMDDAMLDAVLTVASRHRIHGFIASNLTKQRDNISGAPAKGGISGKLVEGAADKQLDFLATHAQGRYTLVGCGGIFSAEDAYKKIRKGASLVQLATGMIFQGPQLIGDINRGLASLLRRDGFSSIREAVGVDCVQ